MASRMQRVQIAQETMRILHEKRYLGVEGAFVEIAAELEAAEVGSRFFLPEELESILQQLPEGRRAYPGPQVRIALETTIHGIRYFADRQAPNVLALNFASAKNPGGGFLSGAQAQEESLARASGLYLCLTKFMKEMYHFHRDQRSPFYSDRMIYSPAVPFFRDDQFILLPKPFLASVITSPAVNAGALLRNAPEQLMAIAPTMRHRTGLMLALARHLGYRDLVLGAWGCGVFQQDPEDVAGHFRFHIYENPVFAGAFDRIRFSILDTTSDQRIIKPFQQVFEAVR